MALKLRASSWRTCRLQRRPCRGHCSHAEIEAAYCFAEAGGYGVLLGGTPWIHHECVLRHQPSQADQLFISLRRSESRFSPHPRTRDRLPSLTLFHGERQNSWR